MRARRTAAPIVTLCLGVGVVTVLLVLAAAWSAPVAGALIAATVPPPAEGDVGAHVYVRESLTVNPVFPTLTMSPNPPTQVVTTGPASPTGSPTGTVAPIVPTRTTGSAGGSTTTGPVAGGGAGGMPTTGEAVWRPAVLGIAAIAVGALIAWWAARRRRARDDV